MMNANLIDPQFPELGSRFDTNRDEFTIYQAAMLWTGQEPAEDGFFSDDLVARLRLDKYRENSSVFDALIVAIERGEFSIIPMKAKDGSMDGFVTRIPCDQLRKWATDHGGVPAFLENESATNSARAPARQRSVPVALSTIIRAFTIKDANWWRSRARNCTRDYKKLAECRASKGAPGREPTWYPDEIAAFLVGKAILADKRAASILRKEFKTCPFCQDLAELLDPLP